MMVFFTFFVCGIQPVFAEDWSVIYRAIEENNITLKAMVAESEHNESIIRSQHAHPNPQVDGFYLVPMEAAGTDYVELEVTQGFDSPFLYAARSKKEDLYRENLAHRYRVKRQEILLQAEQYLLNIVYLHKRMELEQERHARAKKNLDHFEKLWKAGAIDRLVLNKAKMVWLQDQFVLNELRAKRDDLQLLLRELQGGIELSLVPTEYANGIDLPSLEQIWRDIQHHDSTVHLLQGAVVLAQHDIQLETMAQFPSMRLGYNMQGNQGQMFAGLYLGLDIPLWAQSHRRKAAILKHRKTLLQEQAYVIQRRTRLEIRYDEHNNLVEKYREYGSVLDSIRGEALLEQAFQQGEMSYREYHHELSFYRKAVDDMLNMEWRLQQSRAELLQQQFAKKTLVLQSKQEDK